MAYTFPQIEHYQDPNPYYPVEFRYEGLAFIDIYDCVQYIYYQYIPGMPRSIVTVINAPYCDIKENSPFSPEI